MCKKKKKKALKMQQKAKEIFMNPGISEDKSNASYIKFRGLYKYHPSILM